MKRLGEVTTTLRREKWRQPLLLAYILQDIAVAKGVSDPHELNVVMSGSELSFKVLLSWEDQTINVYPIGSRHIEQWVAESRNTFKVLDVHGVLHLCQRIAKRGFHSRQKTGASWQVEFMPKGIVRLDEEPMTFRAE